MTSYDEAVKRLGNRDSRKVANNTYMQRRENGTIAIRLHSTDVVTFHPDGRVTLDAGGWRTVTTKQRMNLFAPAGVRISQDRGLWTVQVGGWENGVSYGYADGITIHPDGTVSGATADPRTELKLRASIRKYVAGYMAALKAGEVEAPGAGDCFFCGMRVVEPSAKAGETLGEASHDTSHLMAHMRERYYVPSLAARAVETFHNAPAVMQQLYSMFAGSGVPAFMNGDWAGDRIAKALRRYLYRQFGLAA